MSYTTTIDGNVCIGNTLTTFNTNFSNLDAAIAALENQDNVSKGWGSFDTASETFLTNYNMLSAGKLSTGQYKFIFNTNVLADYAVILSGSASLSGSPVLEYGYTHTKTVSSFNVTWINGSGLTDPEIIDFTVFSN